MEKPEPSVPWRAKGKRILDSRGIPVGEMRSAADAARIVAAVNAVARIPTPMLESGAIQSLLWNRVDQLLAQIPGLAELLDSDLPDPLAGPTPGVVQ